MRSPTKRFVPWILPMALAGAACAVRPYAFRKDPGYASLPRINLTLTSHSLGPNLTAPARDLRHGIEAQLAEKRVAAAVDMYDERLPTIHIEMIDRGSIPSNSYDARSSSSSGEPRMGNAFADVHVSAANQGLGSWGMGDFRIVDVVVNASDRQAREPVTIGSVRALMGYDFVSADKAAEVVALLVQRHLPPNPAQ
jgi:hypothetical protein